MPWEQAFPRCFGNHEIGYVCSMCARGMAINNIYCPLCQTEDHRDEEVDSSFHEIITNQSVSESIRLARFNHRGRERHHDNDGWEQEEPSR